MPLRIIAPGTRLPCPNDMSEIEVTSRYNVFPAGTSTATDGSSMSLRGLSSTMPGSRIGNTLFCTILAFSGLVPTASETNMRPSSASDVTLASSVGVPATVSGPDLIGTAIGAPTPTRLAVLPSSTVVFACTLDTVWQRPSAVARWYCPSPGMSTSLPCSSRWKNFNRSSPNVPPSSFEHGSDSTVPPANDANASLVPGGMTLG